MADGIIHVVYEGAGGEGTSREAQLDRELRITKRKQWCVAWVAGIREELGQAFTGWWVGGFISAITVIVLLILWGESIDFIREEIVVRYAALFAAVVSFALWLVYVVAASAADAGKRIEQVGRWSGREFTLHEPALLVTQRVLAQDPTLNKRIEIAAVPPGSLVRFVIEAPKEWCVVLMNWPTQLSIGGSGAVRVNAAASNVYGDVYFSCWPCRPNLIDTVVRVRVSGWAFQPLDSSIGPRKTWRKRHDGEKPLARLGKI